MENAISPTKKALTEALGLSAEILKNIELSEIPLEKIALKTERLARLLVTTHPSTSTVKHRLGCRWSANLN